jgi:hypothetical protein
MKSNLFADILILLIAFAVFITLLFLIPRPTHQVINCSLAEISPDFSPEMRKECRMIRGTKL